MRVAVLMHFRYSVYRCALAISKSQPCPLSFENQMALYICSPNYWTVIWTCVMGKWTGDWLSQICIRSHCASLHNRKEAGAIFQMRLSHTRMHTQTRTHMHVHVHTQIDLYVQKWAYIQYSGRGYRVTILHLSPCPLVPDTWSLCPCLILTDWKSCECLQSLERGMFVNSSHSRVLDCKIQIFIFYHGDEWYNLLLSFQSCKPEETNDFSSVCLAPLC